MLANQSVQYMRRMNIVDGGVIPTIKELIDFLISLTQSQQGNFTVIGIDRNMSVIELMDYLQILDKIGPAAYINYLRLDQKKITHYTLNGHNQTLTLD